MKILHVGAVDPDSKAAGPNHSIRGLAKAQAEIGLQAGLITSYPMPKGSVIEGIEGVCFIDGLQNKHYNPWNISDNWERRICKKFGEPDLVNFHSTYIPFHIALARTCRKLNWPYIITPRGGMTYLAQNIKGAKKKVSNFLYYRSYVKHAAAIHALCQREAQEIGDLFETKKIIIAPNGVEDYLLEAPSRLQPAELDDFNCKGDLVLGFVGRLDVNHKGIDLLFEAMAILKSKPEGLRFKLFLIGPFYTKKDKRIIFSIIEKYQMQEYIKLLGPKYGEEKLRHFLACDVFVHTSRFEGMPMAVIEAMAIGKPCMATPGTNMADIVCRGGGWECKESPESIAQTLNSIYNERDSIKLRGQKSHKLIKSEFTWRQIAQNLIKEYNTLLEKQNSQR